MGYKPVINTGTAIKKLVEFYKKKQNKEYV